MAQRAYITYVLIALSVLVFCFPQNLGANKSFIYAFSLIPIEIVSGTDITGVQTLRDADGFTGQTEHFAAPFGVYFNFFSSMFLHADLHHLAGNMLFLWIFGEKLEKHLGRVRFTFFYFVCGILAAAFQIFFVTNSLIPMIGASGAISGVLGGFGVLFPKEKLKAVVFDKSFSFPAVFVISLWIEYQIVLGYFTPVGTGGVGYLAHIGGFIVGAFLVKFFAIGKEVCS